MLNNLVLPPNMIYKYLLLNKNVQNNFYILFNHHFIKNNNYLFQFFNIMNFFYLKNIPFYKFDIFDNHCYKQHNFPNIFHIYYLIFRNQANKFYMLSKINLLFDLLFTHKIYNFLFHNQYIL